MAIPSQVQAHKIMCWKGVETKRQAPVFGEEIVQITNPKGITKVVVKCITDWSLVRSQPGPVRIKNN